MEGVPYKSGLSHSASFVFAPGQMLHRAVLLLLPEIEVPCRAFAGARRHPDARDDTRARQLARELS